MDRWRSGWPGIILLLVTLLLAACAGGQGSEAASATDSLQPLSLPQLQPADVGRGRLQVVATTSIVGDVVAEVGGEAIELTTLMGAG